MTARFAWDVPDDQGRAVAGDLGDRPGGEAAALVHDDHVGAGLLHLAEQVAGQDHGPALGRVPEQDIAHLADLRRVEAVHRLVEDQQVGQAEHGLGDGQPLAHPPRVGPHPAVERGPEPGDLQDLVQVRPGGGPPGGPPVQVQVGPAGQVRQEPGSFDERPEPGQRGRAGPDLLAEDVIVPASG